MSVDGKKVLVTGATGLVGSALCRELARRGAKVVALVRSPEKAKARLPAEVETVVGDVRARIDFGGEVDFVVHAAGPTASSDFVERPVEVIDAVFGGARNVLDFALDRKVEGLVFLSTMEVYGLTDSENVAEDGYASLDTMCARSSYPEAKRLAECLFASAAKERGLRAMVARLTQTFGAGVARDDRRVFAEFARAAVEGRDIVLKSSGATARCYCALPDAVSAIIAILERGEAGVAYNVANPSTFCTIREMAELVAREFGDGRCRVVVGGDSAAERGYLPEFKMNLNVDRLKALGWSPAMGLKEMFGQLLDGWR